MYVYAAYAAFAHFFLIQVYSYVHDVSRVKAN